MDLKKILLPTENPHHSSKWISGKELIDLRGIRDFELFDRMKMGLQAYDSYGKKIIDSDSLERAPRDTLEHIEALIRGAGGTYRVLGRPGTFRRPPTEWEIKAEARKAYKAQPLEIVNLPKNCEPFSFTIPEDEKKAEEAILKAMSFLFKMEEVLSFERKHGLVSQEPQSDSTLSAIRPSQDDRGLDVQKYIDKCLADGVPKEKIAVDLKENFKLSFFNIGRLLNPEGLNSGQRAALKQRGQRLYKKGLELITEEKKGKKAKKR
jgi:hypothetical protein